MGKHQVPFFTTIAIIMGQITVVQHKTYDSFLSKASELSPDPGDIPILALALAHDIPIWTHDAHLWQQTTVKIVTNHDLLQI